MFIPDKINVNGIDYTIIQQEFDPEEANYGWAGMCNETRATIYVRSTLDPQKKIQVFFHELIHAYLAEAGYKKEHDEMEITAIAAGFYHTLKQLQQYNPELGAKGDEQRDNVTT